MMKKRSSVVEALGLQSKQAACVDGLVKKAVIGPLLAYGGIPHALGLYLANRQINWNDLRSARNAADGKGSALDLHNFLDEDGFVHDIGGMNRDVSKAYLGGIPHVLTMAVPLYDDLVADPSQRRRIATNRFYATLGDIARAGIEVGRNGSTEGIINNRNALAREHVNPKFTRTQRKKLREEYLIDPRTGAPLILGVSKSDVRGFDKSWHEEQAEQLKDEAKNWWIWMTGGRALGGAWAGLSRGPKGAIAGAITGAVKGTPLPATPYAFSKAHEALSKVYEGPAGPDISMDHFLYGRRVK
jgi:hypothetical protein